MATLNKIFIFSADLEGFIAYPENIDIVMTYDSGYGNPSGSLKTRIFGRNKLGQSYWEWSGTWEDLGISSGNTITQVRINNADNRCTEWNVVDSCFIGPYSIYDSLGTTLIATLWSGRAPSGVEGSWTQIGNQVYQNIAAAYEASNTIIKIRIYNNLDLANDGAAAMTVYDDTISLDIDYTSSGHTLLADGIITTPVVGTPSMGQTHLLVSVGITTTPVVGTPSIGQTHLLVSVGITTTSVVGTPIVGQDHILDAVGITTISVVGTSSIGQTHLLVSDGIVTTSVVGTPSIGQDHILSSVGITTNPVVGIPSIEPSGRFPVIFLLRDEFFPDEDAPIVSPRKAKPGPGELTITDTGGNSAISGGKFQLRGYVSDTDPYMSASSQIRAAGVALFVKGSHTDRFWLGWDLNGVGFPPSVYPHFRIEGNIQIRVSGSIQIEGKGVYDDGDYIYLIVLRSTGAFIFAKGPAYSEFTLLFVEVVDSTAIVYPVISYDASGSNDIDFEYFRVAQLAAPWNTDNGIATDEKLGVVPVDTTFVHEADCLIEFELTALLGISTVRFRIQDIDNYWLIDIHLNGTLYLYEYISGYNQRGSAAEVLSGGERIVVVCDDETITVYYDNTLAFSYTSAANFKTETDGKVSLLGDTVISDLITWPRVISGDALTELEEYTNPPQFLLQDEFLVSDAAPITSPRTAEPGPGTWNVTDPNNKFSIASGILNSVAGVIDNTRLNSPNALTRSAGLLWCSNILGFPGGSDNQYIGFGNTPTVLNVFDGFRGGKYMKANNVQIDTPDIASGIFSVIARASGSFHIVDSTLHWVGNVSTQTPLYPVFMINNRGIAADYVRVAQLSAPWTTDNGLATDTELGAVAAGTTFTHEADCLIEYTVTTMPNVGNMDIWFRIEDANNNWYIRITTLGALNLRERVGGESTTRGTIAAAISGGERIVVICDDEIITVYINNVSALSYISAANFKTETDGEFESSGGGVVSDLITWPRTLSGDALTELERYTQLEAGPTPIGVITQPVMGTPSMEDSVMFFLRDEFLVPDAAPLTSPRTAEPGPGELTVVDTNDRLFISGDKLVWGGGGWGNPKIVSANFSRNTGLASLFRVVRPSGDASIDFGFGTTYYNDNLISLITNNIRVQDSSSVHLNIPIGSGTYDFAVILRTAGAFYINDNIVIWVGSINTDANNPLIIIDQYDDKPIDFKYARVAQLVGPWDTDNGIATDEKLGVVAEGMTFVHEADCIIEYIVDTIPSVDGINIFFREVTSDNTWFINVNFAGALRLFERIDGSGILRANTSEGVIVGGDRIVVVVDDETIKAYYNNTYAWGYTSAVNFKTETDGKLDSLGTGGVVSDIITWPRVISGDALTELEKYTQEAASAPIGVITQPVMGTPSMEDSVMFFLRDEFLTAEAAPLTSPRTAEPGPGTLLIKDTGDNADIVDGMFVFSGFVTTADPTIHSQFTYARIAGLASIFIIDGTDLSKLKIGFDVNRTLAPTAGFKFDTLPGLQALDDGLAFTVGEYSIGNFPETYAVIMRSAGDFLIEGSTLIWVGIYDTIDPAYVGFSNASQVYDAKCNSLRVAQLSAPWDTDNGIATDEISGTIPDEAVFVHEADFIGEFIFTTLHTISSIAFVFREQDIDNHFRLDMLPDGSILLQEKIGGVSYQRASVGEGAITNGARVVTIVDDETVSVYINNIQKFTYVSAINFKIETSGRWSETTSRTATIDDLITWPRVISGEPLAELEKYTEDYSWLVVGITITPVVGTPVIGQTQLLLASGIVTTPVVGTPELTHIHALTAVGIISTPVVGTPELTQIHALIAIGIISTPVVGTPVIGQEHLLLASGVVTNPVVGAPELTQIHVLIAVGIISMPVVGTPFIGQVHVLSSVGIISTPVVGTPELLQIHELIPIGITTTPEISIPEFMVILGIAEIIFTFYKTEVLFRTYTEE